MISTRGRARLGVESPCDPVNLTDYTGSVYSRYKRLGDNEMDENYFPVLWRDDGYRTAAIESYLNNDA